MLYLNTNEMFTVNKIFDLTSNESYSAFYFIKILQLSDDENFV